MAEPIQEDQVAQPDKAGEASPPSQSSAPLEGANKVLLDANPTGVDRSHKGFGDLTGYPTELDVQKLRQNQADPNLLKLFDSMYGAGSSKRYLNYPSMSDVKKLLENREDPDMVKLFDRTYGDISKSIVPLYDPKTGADDRMLAASHLNYILGHGKGWADTLTENSVSEGIGSITHGVTAGVKELARSGAEGIDAITGTKLADQIGDTTDTRLTNHPLINGVISGISQFVTDRAIVGAVTGGAGLAKDAGKVATAFREMSLAGFVNAFGFNANDPLLGDVAKALGMGDNWFTKLDSIDTMKTEAERRGMRAAEGTALGAAIDLLGLAYRSVKAFKAGDIKGAEDAKARVADIIEQKQLELPLNDNLPEQVQPTFANKGLMDLPVERRLDALPDSLRGKPAETSGEMEIRLKDKWGVDHQLPLDLGPPKEGPFLHAREPGAQGELFTAPTAKPKPEQGELFHDQPPPSYSKEEIANTSREQFIKDQIEENPPIVREAKAGIEGERPSRTELPQTIRDIIEKIPDFTNYSIAAVKGYVAPLLNDFLRVTKTSPIELERIMTTELHPQDVMKIQALTSTAMKKAEDAARIAGAQLNAFKKAKVTNADELEKLAGQVKEANSLIADLQKLDIPLSAHAGRLLQQRQIEARITAAHRVNIADLRSKGVSEERINLMLRTAMDRVDTTRLSELTQERVGALNKGDKAKVEQLDGLIKDEMKAVEKRANSEAKSLHNMIVKDITGYTITNILSGFGTVIRNVFGILGHNPIYRVNQMAGMIDKHGFSEGLQGYALQAKARSIALRYGHQSTLKMLQTVLKDSAIDAFHNETKANVKGYAGTPNRISGDKYGMTGVAGKALNAFGRGSELLTLPLRMSDEVASEIIGRQAVGTRAAFNFFESLQGEKGLVEAKLRDPNLSAAQRAALQQELKTFSGSNPTATIDGQKVRFKDHIEGQVQKAYDATGRLVDQDAVNETNYILLRNRQTPSMFGQAIEKSLNTTPYLRFLVPVFNAPMNGFKRGFEMVPVLRRGLTDLNAELKSPDPYIQAMARGKLHTGYAYIGTALLLADSGLISVADTNKRSPRLSDQASSSVGPFQLSIAGTHWELPGLDPVSIPLVWAAVFMDSLKKYNAAYDQQVAIQDAKGEPIEIMEQRLHKLLDVGLAIGGATGQAIIQNPAVSGMKDVVDLLMNINKMSEDDNSFNKEADKLVRGQLGKLLPTAYRQMIGLFDSKRYDPKTIMDVLNSVAGHTADAPLLYDMMGRPMESKAPTRSLLGPLAALHPPNKDSKAQYVIDTLDNWGQITGKYYTFDTNPPDSLLKRYGIDLRAIDSLAGDRKVQDQFAKNYRTVEVHGRTIEQTLYGIVTEAAGNDHAIGNKIARGDIFSKIDSVVNEYKNLAWELTLRKELAANNSPLFKLINSAYAMQYAAQDRSLDRPDDQYIQQRTREMLQLFPR